MNDMKDVTISEDCSEPGPPANALTASQSAAPPRARAGRARSSLLHRGACRVLEFVAAGAPPDRALALSGTTVKHYEIVRTLGRGGNGVVFLARDTRLDRLVALKFLRPRSQREARLLHEARTMARFRHENIVTVYEVSAVSGCPFIAIEYVEGHTLRDARLDPSRQSPRCARASFGAGGAMPPYHAVKAMIPVARALDHAHDLGIVHCDLKPENILLSDTGRVKVVDFGLARQLPRAPSLARSFDRSPAITVASTGRSAGRVAGTLRYMSPEQLRGEVLDERADLWAVGIILHELVTGRHPLASTGWLRAAMDLEVPMPMAAVHDPSLGALGRVIGRCLMKRRDDRLGSARELLTALEAIAEDEARHAAAGQVPAHASLEGCPGSRASRRQPLNEHP